MAQYNNGYSYNGAPQGFGQPAQYGPNRSPYTQLQPQQQTQQTAQVAANPALQQAIAPSQYMQQHPGGVTGGYPPQATIPPNANPNNRPTAQPPQQPVDVTATPAQQNGQAPASPLRSVYGVDQGKLGDQSYHSRKYDLLRLAQQYVDPSVGLTDDFVQRAIAAGYKDAHMIGNDTLAYTGLDGQPVQVDLIKGFKGGHGQLQYLLNGGQPQAAPMANPALANAVMAGTQPGVDLASSSQSLDAILQALANYNRRTFK